MAPSPWCSASLSSGVPTWRARSLSVCSAHVRCAAPPRLQLDVSFAGVEMENAVELPETSFTAALRVLTPNGTSCPWESVPATNSAHISRDPQTSRHQSCLDQPLPPPTCLQATWCPAACPTSGPTPVTSRVSLHCQAVGHVPQPGNCWGYPVAPSIIDDAGSDRALAPYAHTGGVRRVQDARGCQVTSFHWPVLRSVCHDWHRDGQRCYSISSHQHGSAHTDGCQGW